MAKTKITYEYIQEFIKINNGNLLTDENEYNKLKEIYKVNDKIKIRLLCSCGNEYSVPFSRFKYANKRQCNFCGQKLREKGKRKTIDEIKNIIKSHDNGCVLLEDNYKNTKTKMNFQCKCGNIFTTSWENYLYKTVRLCEECRRIRDKIQGTINWEYNSIKKYIEENSECILISDYVNYDTNMTLRCKCGELFEVNFYNFRKSNQRQCFKCGHKKGSEKQRYKISDIKKIIKLNNKNIKLISKSYKNCKEHLKLHCNECNGTFLRSWDTMKNNNMFDCPLCKMSKGEHKIYDFLKANNINFIKEFIFDDLVSDNNYYLRFDFAINTKEKILIEYDGEFHYEPIVSQENLENQKYRDNLKNEYCLKNNIPLIRIPYWEFNNIETILEDILINKNLNNIYIISKYNESVKLY